MSLPSGPGEECSALEKRVRNHETGTEGFQDEETSLRVGPLSPGQENIPELGSGVGVRG